MDIPFFPGKKPDRMEPLGVFLPPHNEGVGREFLRRFGGPGIRVIDPFGQSPALALEMARAGATVLAASPNPILRLLFGLQADPPSSASLRSVFQRLARLPFSPSNPNETFEQHIRSLYKTSCSICQTVLEADAFIWAREDQEEAPKSRAGIRKPAPYRLSKRMYRCPQCDRNAEEPAIALDEKTVEPYLIKSGYHHLALEIIAAPDDPIREHAEEALAVYPPRSLYALFAIRSRLEALELSPAERRCAFLLLLSALDEAHVLRGYAHLTRARPRSLQLPAEYRESNVWRMLERAVEEWSMPSQPVPIRKWKSGEPVAEGGISLFTGTARELAEGLDDVRPDAVICYLPRPNQAAWTLSAMWSGWLWGRSAAESLGGVLRRRRYDWNWHARALFASASALGAHLPPGTPVATLIGESEPGFLAASMWGFSQASYDPQGAAHRADTDTTHLVWHSPPAGSSRRCIGPRTCEPSFDVARLASRKLISFRAEPTPWELLHAAAWYEVAARRMLPLVDEKEEEAGFSHCTASLHEAIEKDPELVTARREESDLGQTWWLPEPDRVSSPLSDQVETEVLRILLEHGPIAEELLDAHVCTSFPGLLTPEIRLLRACLQSYGVLHGEKKQWKIREEDFPDLRELELEGVVTSLVALGGKLGFRSEGTDPLRWLDSGGRLVYAFCPITSAAIGKFLLDPDLAPECSFIVLPGGRASLVEYKLRRNPRLHRAVERGWRFLKFRHVRRLREDPMLAPENLDSRLSMDPLGASEDQISFL